MNLFTNQHQYNTVSEYLKQKYNSKVFKVSLNGNFTCPNRDGTISKNGCIFCSLSGSGEFGGNPLKSLKEQFIEVSSKIQNKWKNSKYIVYFQANTNTYKPLNELKKLFEEAINLDKDIVGISIATRPDCLSEETLDYLYTLNLKIPVWIELGLQTINEKVSKVINRGYSLKVFEKSVLELKKRNIEVIVHIINGLPYETEYFEIIKYLNNLKINGIKIHSLFVLKNTVLEKMFEENLFKELSYEEYIEITSKQISLLNQDIIVHRINGDPDPFLLVSPLWSLKKFQIMNDIDKYMKKFDLYQGKKLDI